MSLSHIRKRTLVFLILLATLMPVTAWASGAIGKIGSRIVISNKSEEEKNPSIAYNTQRNEYLVVWYNDRAGNDDIRAQRVRSDGKLIGGPFYIAATNGERRYPDVAYNSVHDQYFVVWEFVDSSGFHGIHGRRVSGSGQVLDSNDIIIQSDSSLSTPAKPAIAYASTADRYLIAWAETWHPSPMSHYIYGRRYKSDGTADGNAIQIKATIGNTVLQEADLAYNRHANRFLVVWQTKNGAVREIRGQQVTGKGKLYKAEIAIALGTVKHLNPAVAALPTCPGDYKFFVVWQNLRPAGDVIYGRLISEAGIPDAFLTKIDDTTTTPNSHPAIAGNESGNRYLVAWSEDIGTLDKAIMIRMINFNGLIAGTVIKIPGLNADFPAAASGKNGDFLVAYHDHYILPNDWDIYGQLLGNRIFLPMNSKGH